MRPDGFAGCPYDYAVEQNGHRGMSQPTLAIRWVFPTSRGLLTHLSDERLVLGGTTIAR